MQSSAQLMAGGRSGPAATEAVRAVQCSVRPAPGFGVWPRVTQEALGRKMGRARYPATQNGVADGVFSSLEPRPGNPVEFHALVKPGT